MDVSRWMAAIVPWWVTRVVLTGGWVAAVAAAIHTSPLVCTPDAPCSPDPVFAIAVTLLLATPVLLVWLPVTGCLAGAAFGALDLLFDPVPAAQAAFGLHGFACAVVAIWLLRSRAEQRQLASGAPVRVTGIRTWGLSPLMAVVFFVAGVWAFLAYDSAVASIDAHASAAMRMDARIVEVRTADLTVELPDRQRVAVDTLVDQYRVGDRVPVLADGSWVRLVAEPEDATWLLTLGFAAFLVVFLLVIRAWQRRALWDRLLPSVVLAVEPLGGQRVLLSRDGCALGVLRIDADLPAPPPRYTDSSHFGRVWRGEEAPPAVDLLEVTVAGDLSYGGRVIMLVEDVALPSTLRPPRRALSHELPGTPVASASVDVPPVVYAGRPEGVLLLTLAVAFCFVPHLVPGGALCLAAAWLRLQPQLRLEHTTLVVHAGLFVYRVPWPHLHGVRSDGTRLYLAFGPSADLVTVPFSPGLGEALMIRRARALMAADGRAVTRRLGPVPLAVLAYIVFAWFLHSLM